MSAPKRPALRHIAIELAIVGAVHLLARAGNLIEIGREIRHRLRPRR